MTHTEARLRSDLRATLLLAVMEKILVANSLNEAKVLAFNAILDVRKST